jgi:hypothetical protein
MNPRTSVNEKKYILLKYSFMRSLAVRLLPYSTEKEYIFIVGCYSSGTTLLNYILGKHPEISSLLTEGASLTKELLTPEEVGSARLMHPCLNLFQDNINRANIERLIKDWAVYHDNSKPFFLEKSISNWARISWLIQQFNSPWIIWVIRDGYSVMEGLRRRSETSMSYTSDEYPKGFPMEICAREWIISNETIEKQVDGYKKVIPVKYESLTENTEETIKGILAKLPFKNKTLDIPSTFKFHGKERPIKNMNLRSIENLSRVDYEIINEIASKYFKKWDYPIIQPGTVAS